VDEAVRSGGEVDAVASYAVTDYWTDLSTVVVPSLEQIRDDLRHRTGDVVEDVLRQRPSDRPVPTIRTSVVEGPAGEVLVERSGGADLLVVGSRGRGRIRGLLLGSVALHCAMHAHCPVLIVHPQRTTSPVAQAVPEPAMAGG
jgi:nucleotide-binding universal stress UspA family protein